MKVKQSKCELEGKYYRWIYSAILLPTSWGYLPLSIALKRRCFEVFSCLDLRDLSVFSHLLWKSLVQPAFDISQITSCLRSNLNQNQAFEEEFTLRKCLNFICHLSNNFNVFFSNVQVSRLLGFQFSTIKSVHSDKEIKTNFKPDFLP